MGLMSVMCHNRTSACLVFVPLAKRIQHHLPYASHDLERPFDESVRCWRNLLLERWIIRLCGLYDFPLHAGVAFSTSAVFTQKPMSISRYIAVAVAKNSCAS